MIEFFLPALCVATLYFIKLDLQSDPNSSLKSVVVPSSLDATPPGPGADDTIIPFSFQDYVTALQAKRVCVVDPTASALEQILGLAPLVISGINYKEWPVPFIFCNSYSCRIRGENATDYCTYRTLALAPMNADVKGEVDQMLEFKGYVENRYPQLTSGALPFEHDFIQIFGSNEELDSYVTSETYGGWADDGQYNPKVAIGVLFSGGGGGKSYEYTIRTNSTNFNSEENSAQPVAKTTPNTERVFEPYNREDSSSCSTPGAPNMGRYGGSCTGQYMLNGAVTIQRLLDDWILSDNGVNTNVAQSGATFLPFPTNEYIKTGFYENISAFAPLLFTLGLLYPISSTIRSLVLEKELRQKELMKMLSITECDIGWSWFVSFYLFFGPCGAITAVFTNLLYSSSSYLWLFIFWQLSFIACIVYCFLIASISTKATRATLIGIMLFFVGYFLPFIVDYQDGSSALITLLSLHPVTAYTYGLTMMGYLEDAGVGVQTTTITSSEFPSGYTFASSLFMLFFDSILWGVTTWYLNRILRGDYGTALKWYFPIERQYWCPKKSITDEPTPACEDVDVPFEAVGDAMKNQQAQGKKGVHIYGLRKQFGEKTAVDGLNLSMYSGQITALLGHNGAGKTTTIGVLTGMMPPTEGYATVSGYDIRTDLSLLRENIGVCLQHDCLFPQLSVLEHIQFFSRVKGLYARQSKEECEKSVMTAIEDVALMEKRHSFAKDLSGGMKRKLSVAIAFCGGSEVIFLDEPTSGMDPFSRRFTWNVIRQYRENRCIILTTHFMDEADLLGDRIAIMAQGRLCCVGSSLFLKKHYGVGYQLTIIKKPTQENNMLAEEEKEEAADGLVKYGTASGLDATLEDIVKGAVPSAALLSNVGTEMSFQLPISESASFISMFEKLDEQSIIYGVSVTTLDEVFLMVARGAEGLQISSEQEPATKAMVEEDSTSYRHSFDTTEQSAPFRRHVRALFAKRAKNFKRDKKAWCCSTILPTMITLLGFLAVNFLSKRNTNYPNLALSLDQNNPEIKVERNPIPYNKPSFYDCQPGNCIYENDTVDVMETSELYYFCGANAKVDTGTQNEPSPTTCTIEDSTNIINQISQYGAFGVGSDATDVLNSSISVFETSQALGSGASVYGGIFFTHDEKSVTSSDGSTFDQAVIESCTENTGSYMTEEECVEFGGIGYIINYNFTSLHSSLLYQAKADEALMRHYLNDAGYKISVSVWPLPITQVEEEYTQASNSFAAWFLLVLSFPFIAGSFATFIVAERETKAKHLQTVAGVQPTAYWLSTYCWDIMNYQIPLWTVIILMYALDIQSFITQERQVASSTFVLLILFGPAAAGFTYIVCFFFKSPSMANLFVIVFNFFIGMAGPLVSMILRLLAADPANPKPSLKNAAIGIEWVLRFIPSFCLGKGLLFSTNIAFFEMVEEEPLTAWSPAIALYEVIFLGVESILFVLITIQIDTLSTKPKSVLLFKHLTDWRGCLKWCFNCSKLRFQRLFRHHTRQDDEVAPAMTENDDEDVIAENERVESGNADNDLIVLDKLSKVYHNGKRAVNQMSLGIPPGECFGLLGINGAGKTTCMALLTAEFPPSSGDAKLASFSVKNEPELTRRKIGYCPQFDAHFANMTGWEHVELYAVIKGVPQNYLKEVVASKLTEVGLSLVDGKRPSSEYSGGMKRKLSVACATIGAPQIVFLDEPSTGMDPVARRDLWKVISRMIAGRSDMPESQKPSVILTTHSMEECESLCPRIGIMAGGKLRCLGSAQHLKSRFGRGYQIEMKIKHPADEDQDVASITRQILQHLQVVSEDNEEVDLHELTSSANNINLDQVKDVCENLTGDDYLSKIIRADHPNGYHIYKLAGSAVGITVDEFVGFCVEELRIKTLIDFFERSYHSAILRERQDVKVRYEISSEGVTISSIFSNIEKHKDELMMDDYSVSQTSLEQVFNTFAAVAEKEKENTVDGG